MIRVLIFAVFLFSITEVQAQKNYPLYFEGELVDSVLAKNHLQKGFVYIFKPAGKGIPFNHCDSLVQQSMNLEIKKYGGCTVIGNQDEQAKQYNTIVFDFLHTAPSSFWTTYSFFLGKCRENKKIDNQ